MRRDRVIFFSQNNAIDNAVRRCLLMKRNRFIKNQYYNTANINIMAKKRITAAMVARPIKAPFLQAL